MELRSNSLGLTLIEMLVVLAIIGVMSSMLVLGLGAGAKEQSLQAEAQRLALSLQAASDEGLTSDIPITFSWTSKGYELQGPIHQPDAPGHKTKPDATHRHSLPEEMSLAVPLLESPVRLGDESLPSFAILLTSQGSRWRVDYDGLNAVAVPDG